MKAEKDKVVAVSYTLMVDDGESGKELFETVTEDKPFYFLMGYSNVLPLFEKAVEGKRVVEEEEEEEEAKGKEGGGVHM